MDFSLLSITKVSSFVVDEWTGIKINFRLVVVSPADAVKTLNTDQGTREHLFQRILASPKVVQYCNMAKGKTVEAGLDGSSMEVKVQKPMFIPRSFKDIDDWQFHSDGHAVCGQISGSDR